MHNHDRREECILSRLALHSFTISLHLLCSAAPCPPTGDDFGGELVFIQQYNGDRLGISRCCEGKPTRRCAALEEEEEEERRRRRRRWKRLGGGHGRCR
jgi:hypothetical protein